MLTAARVAMPSTLAHHLQHDISWGTKEVR
jgi:hypothetical protein